MDMAKYLDLFVSEAQEHIQAAAGDVTRLAAEPASQEALRSLFRHFHSIKGMAASMGFAPITDLSHAAEDLLDRMRKSALPWPPDLTDLMMEALDAATTMVSRAACPGGAPETPAATAAATAAAAPEGTDYDPAPLIKKIRAAIPPPAQNASPAGTAAAPVPAEPRPPDAPPAPPIPEKSRFLCVLVIDPRADFPGARAALAIRRLERAGTIVRTDPERDALLTARFSGEITIEIATDRTAAALTSMLADLLDLKHCEVIPVAPAGMPAAAAGAPAGTPSPTNGAKSAQPSTVRVQTATLDWFLDSISDMTARRGAMNEALRSGQIARARETMEKLSDSIDAIREQVMELRLMPFAQIEPRLTRTVREVSRRTGKRVTLTITGSDVSLDRSVLEEMIDPINHILRNAVDHGIELPDERTLAGKPVDGSVRIEVSRVSDHVRILITDDGRGLDVEAIRRTAAEGGFLTPAQLAALDESEVLLLTTIPGFSTAKKVTEVSGRGVGMDVVRTRVEALRGHMSLQSQRGSWTRIDLKVPLTVAVIDAFLVEGRSGLFAVPAGLVSSVLSVPSDRISATLSGSFLNGHSFDADTRDEPDEAASQPSLIPLVSLDDAMGAAATRRRTGDLTVLAYQVNGARAALAVERIRCRQNLVVKPLGPPLERLRRYSGAALLDDGSLALILDMASLGRNL